MCHNGGIIAQKSQMRSLKDFPSAYSPDLIPFDFCIFEMLKGNMKDRAFQTVKEILEAVTSIWNVVTFEQLMSVFLDWMERLEWVISNRWNATSSDIQRSIGSSFGNEMAGGSELFAHLVFGSNKKPLFNPDTSKA
jgi:hypothetical protein